MADTPPPEIGSTVYLDRDGREPMVVLNVVGTTLYLAHPDHIRTGHQGNFYNSEGETEWMI